MKKIVLFDTTLRDGEQAPGYSMQTEEKTEIATALEKLGIDIIEGGFAASSEGDLNAIKKICDAVKDSEIASLARASESDIDAAEKALKNAVSSRIHIFLATSEIHMKYKLKMSESEVLDRIEKSVKYACGKCANVQFSAEDAFRSDRKFLKKALETAIKAGATTVNIADTVGYATPEEVKSLISYLNGMDKREKVKLGIHCHNDLGMATANSISAIEAGADHIEGTINGIGERSGNAALEEIIMALKIRADILKAETKADTKLIYKTCKLVSNITGSRLPLNKPIVGSNAFKHESGIHQHGVLAAPITYEIFSPEDIGMKRSEIILGKHSGKHAFQSQLEEMGYTVTPEEINSYFEKFKALADKKKFVSGKDIEAIIHNNTADLKLNKYSLKSFVIQSHSQGAYANVILLKNEDFINEYASGLGGVDASFTAINKIIGKNLKLLSYSLNAVTEGEDALGEALVKLTDDENTVNGRGVSTDILEASILAYIDGVNKLGL